LNHASARPETDGLTVTGKDGPKAHPRGEHRARQQTCLRAPTPQTGFGLPTTITGARLAAAGVAVKPEAMTHAHQAKAFEGDGLRAHSLHYDSTSHFIGSSGSNTIAVTICCWSAAYVHSGSIMTSLRFPRTTASFRSYCRSNGFNLAGLGLEHPGLKVLDFPEHRLHNAASDASYLATKSFYHRHERLVAARRPGKGARTLLLELLEAVAGMTYILLRSAK
jgi:hypothetical protein